MNKIVVFFLFFVFGVAQAQELNCAVTVNAKSLSNGNLSIFKTLERSVYEFVNKTKWGNKDYKQKERINCSIFIDVKSYESDQFTATIQIQSSRTVYNSTYSSPVFNFYDKEFNFKYVEYEPLVFNPNSFDSNLISGLAFYSNIIIGLDSDTFAPLSGNPYFEAATQIVNTAQQSGYPGWSQAENKQNRYFLVSDLLSSTYSGIRNAMYDYHFKGLDVMSTDLKGGKEKIKDAIISLKSTFG